MKYTYKSLECFNRILLIITDIILYDIIGIGVTMLSKCCSVTVTQLRQIHYTRNFLSNQNCVLDL